jgi:hypothetical protein
MEGNLPDHYAQSVPTENFRHFQHSQFGRTPRHKADASINLTDILSHVASLRLAYTNLEFFKLLKHYQRCRILSTLFVSSSLAMKGNYRHIRYVQGDGCNKAIKVCSCNPIQNNRSPAAQNKN